MLRKTCDSLAYCDTAVDIVAIHTKDLKLCSAVFHKFFGQHFEQDHRSLQTADHFALDHEHLFAHL
jgi:hypothetical protein